MMAQQYHLVGAVQGGARIVIHLQISLEQKILHCRRMPWSEEVLLILTKMADNFSMGN